jgi:hypothetical protein
MAKKAKTNKLKAMLDPESVAVLLDPLTFGLVVWFPEPAVHPNGHDPSAIQSAHPSNPETNFFP